MGQVQDEKGKGEDPGKIAEHRIEEVEYPGCVVGVKLGTDFVYQTEQGPWLCSHLPL
jgi:hypothetical protein